MKPPTKKELVILGSVYLLTTVLWLWIIRSHNWYDALLVSLAGTSGIAGTLFIVGLVNKVNSNDDR